MADKTIPDISTEVALPASGDFFETGSSSRSAKMLVTRVPQQVATRTALKALSVSGIPTGVVVLCVGDTAINDAGGYAYYYDSTSTATNNGVTVLTPDVGSGRWLAFARLNPDFSFIPFINQGTGTGQKILSYVTGNVKYGVAVETDEYRFFAPTGGHVSLGTMSPTDGTTFTPTVNAGAFGMYFPTLAMQRLSKANMAIEINVKDFGATGDGATDDTDAINDAIAALTNNSSLFFPPGKYMTTGLDTISGLTNVRIYGAGAILYQTVQANNLMVIDETCSRFKIDHLIFDGAATSRLTGIHLRMSASYTLIESCEFKGASDYCVFIGNQDTATPTTSVRVIGCLARDSQGDGFHADWVDDVEFVGCVCRNTGDDSFAVIGFQSPADYAYNVRFYDCHAYNAGFRGFALQAVKQVVVANCSVEGSVGSGIEVSVESDDDTSVFNEDVVIRSCDIRDAISSPGPVGAFNIYFTKRALVEGVTVTNPVNGSCVALFDFDDVQLKDVQTIVTRTGFARGIFVYDGLTIVGRTPRTNWGALSIDSAAFNMTQSDNSEAIHVKPNAAYTISNLLITGATGSYVPTGNYIVYGEISGAAKIGNNTCLQARTIAQSGGGVAATVFNNN